MDPQPHPLLHFLFRMKQTPTSVFLQVAKNVEVTRGKIWAVWRILKCFPAKSLKRIPSPNLQYGDGRCHAKGWFHPTAFQGVLTLWRVAAPSATEKRTTSLCSSLLVSISNVGRTHFTHAHLQSSKETTVWTCAFSLCMSPALQMAVSIHRPNNVARFCEECVLWRVFGFRLTTPHIYCSKRGLGRFFTGFLPFSPTTNLIAPFLHTHLIHFRVISSAPVMVRQAWSAGTLATHGPIM